MRWLSYVIVLVFGGLLLGDMYYVLTQQHEEAKPLPYDIAVLDEVLLELRRLNNRGRFQEALLLVYDARKIHEDNAGLSLAAANAMIGLESHEPAVKELDKVLAKNPDHISALGKRARSLRDLHRIDGHAHRLKAAWQDVRHMLTLNAEHEEALFIKGTLEYAELNFEAAVQSFTGCISVNKKATSAYYNRAYCYAELNNMAAAIADMKAVLEFSNSEKLKETARAVIKEWEENK